MTQSCPECGGATTWDDGVGSAVCISCGTLTDPSQSVLTSQYNFSEDTNQYSSSWDTSSGKRVRFSNWALADQGKEARNKRNSVAMTEFMDSLSRSFNATGLSTRAMNIFFKAKEIIHFRWGHHAKPFAGACLAIALRESSRPDCLRDISFLLDEPFPTLSRTFICVTSALNISLSRIETSSYIPILHQYMSSLQTDASNSLPAAVTQELSSISFHAVNKTATSLSHILARIGTPSVIKGPLPSVTCAIFILSLESELRSAINHLTPLAQAMGNRLNVGKGAVMACYKAIQDTLATLAENVPWLDKYELKNGRARVAKRNVVARAIRDIVVFYNDTWKATKKPCLDIIRENDTQFLDQDRLARHEGGIPPRKRRKTEQKVAMQFLLDPVSGPLPSSHSSSLDAEPSTPLQSIFPLLTYYLSAPVSSQKPTRLQLLAAVRGGADGISDNELFEEGEMESLLRNEEEVKVVARMYDWGENSEITSDSETGLRTVFRTSNVNRHANRDDSKTKGSHNRINLDALARFLNDEDTEDDQPFTGLLGALYDSDMANSPDSEPESEHEINQPPPHETRLSSLTPTPRTFSDEEIILEGWRATSPGGSTIIGDDRYEEVYN